MTIHRKVFFVCCFFQNQQNSITYEKLKAPAINNNFESSLQMWREKYKTFV